MVKSVESVDLASGLEILQVAEFEPGSQHFWRAVVFFREPAIVEILLRQVCKTLPWAFGDHRSGVIRIKTDWIGGSSGRDHEAGLGRPDAGERALSAGRKLG